ncbi:rhodanese-like domain-containing protein [Pseudomonadota bacterium]
MTRIPSQPDVQPELKPGEALTRKGIDELPYAGNITPTETWQRLEDDPTALLIDVRTTEEWAYVGVPDVDELGHHVHYVPWLFFPRMNVNPEFVQHVIRSVEPETDTPMYFLCRSGIRSAYAAHAMTEAGYTQCFNVTGGFEGDMDDDHRRGSVNGWKVAGLPWEQN